MGKLFKGIALAAAMTVGITAAGCAPAEIKDGAGLMADAAASEELMETGFVFGADLFTGEFSGTYQNRGNGSYIKVDPTAGRDYLYRAGQAVAGDSYVFSGTITMSHCYEDAESEIILKSGSGFVRFALRYNNANSYSLISHLHTEAEDDYRALAETSSGRVNFLVLWHEQSAYLYLDNTFTASVEAPFATTHLGFGGCGCRVELDRFSVAQNGQTISKLLADLKRPFGRHVTGDADYYEAIFLDIGDGYYEKRSYHYLQTFCYLGGKPVAGNYYRISGTVRMKNADPLGQVALMVCRNDSNKVRFVFEYSGGDSYHIFCDRQVNGAFTDYKNLGSAQSTIRFTVEYVNGVSRFYLEDVLLGSIADDMGVAHFGIGGDKCQFIVSDLTGSFEQE